MRSLRAPGREAGPGKRRRSAARSLGPSNVNPSGLTRSNVGPLLVAPNGLTPRP